MMSAGRMGQLCRNLRALILHALHDSESERERQNLTAIMEAVREIEQALAADDAALYGSEE